MRCSSMWPRDVWPLVQCEREAGHRPQNWHRAEHPTSGFVEWQFSDDEREAWKDHKRVPVEGGGEIDGR